MATEHTYDPAEHEARKQAGAKAVAQTAAAGNSVPKLWAAVAELYRHLGLDPITPAPTPGNP